MNKTVAGTRKKKKRSSFSFIAVNLAFLVAWMLILTQIFVFDLSVLLSGSQFGSLVYQYRSLVFLLLTVVTVAVFGPKRTGLYLLYFAIFPLLAPIYLILLFVVNGAVSLQTAIAIMPLVYDFFRSLRLASILWSILLVSWILISFAETKWVLVAAISGSLACSSAHLFMSLRKAYTASVFSFLTDKVVRLNSKVSEGILKRLVTEPVSPVPGGNSNANLRKTDYSLLYLSYSTAEFAATKVRSAAASRLFDFFVVHSWLSAVLTIVCSYSFVFWALFKLDQNHFSFGATPTFVNFVFFSIDNFTTSDLESLQPATTIAKILCYFELIFMVISTVALVFTLFTSAREKFSTDLEKLISSLEELAQTITTQVLVDFQMQLEQIEQLLMSDSDKFVNQIRALRGLPPLEKLLASGHGAESSGPATMQSSESPIAETHSQIDGVPQNNDANGK